MCSTIPESVKNQLNGCPVMPARAAGILGQVTFQSRLRLETGDSLVGLQFIWNPDGTLAQVQIKVMGGSALASLCYNKPSLCYNRAKLSGRWVQIAVDG